MLKRIKNWFFPEINGAILTNIDSESLKNIYNVSIPVAVFELLSFLFMSLRVLPAHPEYKTGMMSVLFCAVICFAEFAVAGLMLRKQQLSHNAVMVFKICCFVVLSLWAIWVSYRQYSRGEQLLTFYAVEILLVCFMLLRPWISTLLILITYSLLYAVLYSIDGAAGINAFNYIVLIFVSVAGMIVSYHSQIRDGNHAIMLQKSNDLLEYTNVHDALTGLRNRHALNEDIKLLAGKHVLAYMIDINYFKEINDNFGHIAGDEVLKETSKRIKTMFPKGLCYRFGGDEFLVLTTKEEEKEEDVYTFTVDAAPGNVILLSIGHAEGDPQNNDELYELIAAADASLYVVKQRTHSPEFGGHERRRRK